MLAHTPAHTPAHHAAAIAKALLQIEALRFSPTKPYTWASGWRRS